MSAIATSNPSVAARLTPSKMTDDGSAPSLPRTSVVELRFAQTSSCSTAAARNVSPAASRTFLPSAASREASLPMVVVLPLPLTPMISRTNGRADAKSMGGAGSDSISVARRRKNAHTASGSASSLRDSELRISSSSFWLVRTPMSAVSSTFSISSTTDGSICFLPAKISPRRAMKPERVRWPGRAPAPRPCARARGRGTG